MTPELVHMTCIKGRGILSRLLSKSASACYPETCWHAKLQVVWLGMGEKRGRRVARSSPQKMKTDFFRILKLNAAFLHFLWI